MNTFFKLFHKQLKKSMSMNRYILFFNLHIFHIVCDILKDVYLIRLTFLYQLFFTRSSTLYTYMNKISKFKHFLGQKHSLSLIFSIKINGKTHRNLQIWKFHLNLEKDRMYFRESLRTIRN